MKKIYSLALCIFLAKLGFAQCGFTVSIASAVNVHCFGMADGSATAQVSGGTLPFTYQWKINGTVIGTSTTINNLAAGTYWFYATDQTACTDSVSVSISEPPPIIIASNPSPATCGQANGFVTFTPVGGTPGYAFMLTPNPGGGCCGNFNNLPPGTYTIMVSDGNGCVSTDVFVINNIPAPTLTVSSTPTQCGMCNGTATATIMGGTAPYMYSWNTVPPQTTHIAQNLCGNTTYTCVVTDAQGCVATSAATIQSSAPGAVNTSVVPSACGQNNGSITVTSAPGLTPPLMYSIQGGTPQASPNFSNLNAGTYTIEATETGGTCTAISTVTVSDSSINVQLNATMPSCGMCDGAVASTVTGGTGPYTYLWNTNAQSPGLSSLCTGNYFLEVTDVNGCYTAASVGLAPPSAPVIQVDTVIAASCSTSGGAQISTTGGTGGITYLWQPGGLTTANPSLAAGVYTVTVTDGGGCSSSQMIYVGSNTTVYVSGSVTSPNCTTNGWITAAGFGGTAPYTYLWSNGSTNDTLFSGNAGIYYVTLTDANGCSGTGSYYLSSGCYNIIKGRVYDDANQNCIQDPGEAGMPGKVVQTAGYQYGYTNANGDYQIYTTEMSTTVFTGTMSYFSIVCPVSGLQPATFAQLGDTVSNADFAYYADPNYFNLGIHPGWSPAHPGFQKQYWVMVENNSPTTQNAVVTFIYDPALQYDSCNNGGVHYAAQHKIEWTFNNIPAGYHWGAWNSRPMAYFTVPVSVSIYDSLQTFFEITPVVGDAYPPDNTLSVYEPVTGSHDPNDKSVIPKGNGPTGDILRSDSTLFYTIHFQNNGNDTAYTVVVMDTLSSNLDPATIVPGASSHPYTFTLSGQGVMTWRFDHIMLVDSLTNEPESNGYFNYTIKQRPNLPYGSEIRNTAYIYFDFNSAIVTNTTLNTVVAPVGLEKLRSENGLILYPNPAANEVMVQFETKVKGDMRLRMYSIVGALVKEQKISNQPTGVSIERLDIAGLQNGIYLVEVSDGNTKSVKKLVIQK